LGVDVLADGGSERVEHVEAGLAALAGGEDGLAAEGGQIGAEVLQVGSFGAGVGGGVVGWHTSFSMLMCGSRRVTVAILLVSSWRILM
jgi:hypothetical protein